MFKYAAALGVGSAATIQSTAAVAAVAAGQAAGLPKTPTPDPQAPVHRNGVALLKVAVCGMALGVGVVQLARA